MADNRSDEQEAAAAAAAAEYIMGLANKQGHVPELNTPNPYATGGGIFSFDDHVSYHNGEPLAQSHNVTKDGLVSGSFSFTNEENAPSTSGWVNGASIQPLAMGGFGENEQMIRNKRLS